MPATDLKADGYSAVSAVPDDRELLRLDLNLEVSACFDLEEPSALCLWHSNHPEIRLEIKKIYDRDYPEPIAKTP